MGFGCSCPEREYRASLDRSERDRRIVEREPEQCAGSADVETPSIAVVVGGSA